MSQDDEDEWSYSDRLKREVRFLRSQGIELLAIRDAVNQVYAEMPEPPIGQGVWRDGVLWIRMSRTAWTAADHGPADWEYMLSGKELFAVTHPESGDDDR